MRILIDGYHLSMTKGTGISTYARNLSRSLHSIGAEVNILYDNGKAASKDPLLNEIQFFNLLENYGFGNEKLSVKTRKIRRLIYALFKGASANEINITGRVILDQFKTKLPYFDNIYNSPDIYSIANVYFILTGKFLNVFLPDKIDVAHWTYPIPLKIVGVKNIYTLHDLIPLRLPYTTLDDKKFYLNLVKMIAKTADKIITVSEASRKDIMEILDVSKDFVVNTYQSVSIPKKYSDLSKLDLTLALNRMFELNYKQYILFIGAIEPKKNVARMLEAYVGSDIDIPLVMVGPIAWKFRDELAILRKNKTAQNNVKRLDYVAFSQLVNLIKGAKFLVFPSLYEGFGLPVIEAMMLGTPVLTSTTGSLREVSGCAAYQVDPYDVQSIRRGMVELVSNDEQCSKLSDLGLKRASKFSAHIYEEKLSNLYSDIC